MKIEEMRGLDFLSPLLSSIVFIASCKAVPRLLRRIGSLDFVWLLTRPFLSLCCHVLRMQSGQGTAFVVDL
jgi:hypothetical protein